MSFNTFINAVYQALYYAFLLVIELSLVTSLAIFFSLLTSPIFSAVATFCLFIAGNAMETIFDRVLYLHHGNWVGRYLIIGIHMVIPNFYNFNISNEIIVWDLPEYTGFCFQRFFCMFLYSYLRKSG